MPNLVNFLDINPVKFIKRKYQTLGHILDEENFHLI